MHSADLGELVDSELRRLPVPRAPLTLLPRVLAAVQMWTIRPWYARAWFTWPLAGQIATVLALGAVAAGSGLLLMQMHPMLPDSVGASGAVSSAIADVIDRIEATATTAEVLYRALLLPLMPIASVFVILMSLACAAFGAALNHVISERSFQR